MDKSIINLKGLGQSQLKILRMMKNKNLIIKDVRFLHQGNEIILTDKHGNDYKKISNNLLHSLVQRNLFVVKNQQKSTVVNQFTYKLKKELKSNAKI